MTQWSVDPRVYTDLSNDQRKSVIKMARCMLRRNINPWSDDDCNYVLIMADDYRRIMNIPFFPSRPDSPVHMWSPIASPAHD